MTLGRWAAASVACVALAGAACSSSGETHDQAKPSTTARATTTTSVSSAPAKCAPAADYPNGTARHTIRVGGVTREFLVHMPPELSHRTMLIVDFHGARSSMQQQAVYSGFDPKADADGFVVATPNATVIGGIRQWNFLGRPDIDFAVAIARELAAHACVDAARVFATGISSGGAMTAALACSASDTFAGFAPVAANFYVPAVCDRARQHPFLIFHGTADPIVPYDGGAVATRQGLPVRPAEATAAQWAAHNGCNPGPVQTNQSSEVVRITWNGCEAPITMYKIVGGGHTWPGASISTALGKTTQQISATNEIVQLFSSL